MKRVNQFERTDRDITNALLGLMNKKSFEKITIQDILEKALINRSTFYQLFPDKYAILERLQDRYINGLVERVEAFTEGGEYDLDKINAALLDYFSDKKEELLRLFAVRSETLDLEGHIRKVFTVYVRRSGSHLSELETELLADFLLRYYVYKMQRGADCSEMSTEMLNIWLEMSITFFRLDPSRPVTCGVNPMLTVWGRMGLAVYKDKVPYQPVPLPEAEIKQPKSGSALFNAFMAKLGKLMNVQTKGRKADDAIAEVSDVLDILGLNYGFLRYPKEVSSHPGRILLGTENRIDSLPMIWRQVTAHENVLGDFCWTAMDYIGEAGIGHWSYPSEKGLPLLAGCGAIDLIGVPDAMNAYQQILWGLRTDPWIGVRPMDHGKERPLENAWRFTNAVPFWTWLGREGEKATVEVFSKAGRVQLLLNGRIVGRKTPKNGIVRFSIPYEPGTLEAVVYDDTGAVTGRSELKTALAPSLRVHTDKDNLRANGQDLAYVMIELADEDGLVTPLGDVRVTAGCTGAGCLQGFGSAACVTDERFTDSVHTAFRGRCLAVLRAGYEPGDLKVTVKAEGYGEKVLHLTVTEV